MVQEIDAGNETKKALAIDHDGDESPVEQRQKPVG
jgi:hypothetical protein